MNQPDSDLLAQVLEATPGFRRRYLGLVEAMDGDPGSAATLTELADYVAEMADEIDRLAPELAGCLAAVEVTALRSDEGAELVAWAFLDSLSPEDRRRLRAWLGPRTTILLAEVEGTAGD